MTHYETKFGAQKVRQIIPQMKQVGTELGINFSYGGSIGNTLQSHRFIWKARELGGSDLQDAMVESLFKAYFEEEKSLGEVGVLRECAVRAGMQTDAVERLLDSVEGTEDVKREEEEYRSKWNCRGVPLFVIDGKFSLSGAQPVEAFLDAFQELDE
mmetsp:Transcript_16202/g.19172  ORF Transcript_16202/g.19172 Transcript_16202/m.19172 type:complete len:156 (+) Transcript_16202:260-727(+)|eukprot:CAMPEP_0198251570 /NCGR_PEP_ID=MMETSP1447-20131203/2366_1 /TAXON_ID=420782 /ORGANISM="Chaetoceros dichaeta, Strain CCMP1751" /LENGTH=155 /DNA_ID=CAMNT_0043936637 /DNA_START=258 /DNA_END=725 /DNA_ORIENTATION=+